MEFTLEELSVLIAFDTADRETTLWELRQVFPSTARTYTRRVMESVIGKLEAMTDEDFDALGLDWDSFGFGWEDYE